MRASLNKSIVLLLVLSIAAPASSAFAQGPVTSSSTFRASVATAVSKSVAADQKPAGQGATKPGKIRAQYGGGGGKGQMIMMLVSTVVGLGVTVYMLKYMQKQQKESEDSVNNPQQASGFGFSFRRPRG
jgi:hypothetical protein